SVRTFLNVPPAPRALHSSPTRRSSDLSCPVLLVHAGGGLVQHQQVRLLGQRPRHERPLLLTSGQCPEWPAGQIGQANLIERAVRSEEHTSELQSLTNLVCRLLLEKKKI